MNRVRRTPILQALVRPSLWWGCDPTALMILSALSAVVGIAGGLAFRQLWLVPLGGALFWFGRRLLLWLAARDAQHPWIFFRAAKYQHVYAARSRWDVAPPARRRWS